MTKSLAERSTKTSAIKIIGTVGHDPDAHRGEMIKVKLLFFFCRSKLTKNVILQFNYDFFFYAERRGATESFSSS